MNDPFFTAVGALFVVVGLATVFNVAGAADRLAAYHRSQRDSPARQRELERDPGRIFPE